MTTLENDILRLSSRLKAEINSINNQDLIKLDYGDRILMRKKLEKLINEIFRIKAIGKAGCSDVIEAFEYLGGEIETINS